MKDWIEVFDSIKAKWNSFFGCIFAVIAAMLLTYTLLHKEPWWEVESATWLFSALGIIVVLGWIVSTCRAFQRTKYLALLWVLLIMGASACFYYLCYPSLIKGTSWDFTAIRYWGTALVMLLLCVIYYLIDFRWYKHSSKLLIVFLVDNNTNADKQIKDSLKEACNKIEDSCDSLMIRVAPIGIVQGKRNAERYVKSPFNQADAVIYSRVMDGNDDGGEGYVFTEFCSFANSKRLSVEEDSIKDVDGIIARESQYDNWNLRNYHNAEATSKLKVAKSIEQLIRLYSTCIYVLKHRLSTAIEMAQSLYNVGDPENSRLRDLAHNLLEFTYLEAEYREELENKDYHHALELLTELSTTVPFIVRTHSYDLAMARVHFHLGNLTESKRYTKLVKDKDPWGYVVNTAFYAMHEGQINKFVSFYRRLPKLESPDKGNVEFVIKFLQEQVTNTSDKRYEAVLLSAIAFQTQYLDLKIAKSRAASIMHQYAIGDIHPELEKLLESIAANRTALPLKVSRKAKKQIHK